MGVGAPQTTRTSGPAVIAQRYAAAVAGYLQEMRNDIRRMLQVLEGANRQNFIGGGTIQGGATVGTAPVTIMEGNPKRTGLNVQNVSAAGGPSLSIGIGNRAPQAGTGITLTPGASWDGRLSGRLCIESISVVGSAAGAQFTWVYAA